MTLPKNFCIAPFLQHTTHPAGSFSPCPYLGGTTWAGSQESIMQQWTSPGLEQLRKDFLDDRQSSICNRCWNEERNNKRSLRQRLYDTKTGTSDYTFAKSAKFAEEFAEILETKKYLQGPKVLTIKNGNICNAKCRVCYPECSSKWTADAKQLKLEIKNSIYTDNLREQNWSDAQLDELVTLASNLVRLELFGGEPLYNKRVKLLLERIVNSGHAQHISLYINTNGSVDFLKRIPCIADFKNIEVGVSIDGIGAHFDYIRHGLEYSQVVNNVVSWQTNLPKDKFSIDCITTVSVLNIFYLPEIKTEITKILPLPPFWNLLVEPKYLYIQNMPDSAKSQIIQKLETDVEEFHDLITVLRQPCDPAEWTKFLEYTKNLDKIRKESFKTTFPEMTDLL